MKVSNPLRHCKSADLKPGDLILKRFGGGNALAIVLAREPRKILYGVLSHPQNSEPTSHETEPTGTCLVFEDGWVIEVIPAIEEAPSRLYTNSMKAGNLLVGDTGPVLIFKPSRDTYDDFDCFNINTSELAQQPSEAAAFGWKIWATENDRNRPNARPVFEWPQPYEADLPPQIA